jgi:ABC-type multidrug transport system ATPase subunit
VAIGLELLNNPKVLFMDEPTTGLDSHSAERLIQLCRKFTELGRTVVATIHQPSSSMVEQFDRLMLMANKKIVFNDDAKKATEFFANAGYPLPDKTNPCEHYLNMLTVEYETPESGDNFYELRMEKLHAAYDSTDMANFDTQDNEEPK